MLSLKISRLKKIRNDEIYQIISILKKENKTSIINNLSKKNLHLFLKKIISSPKFELFCAYNKNIIIGYAIISYKAHFIKNEFRRFSINYLFDFILGLKFLTLINSILSFLNLDNMFLSSEIKNKIYFNSNLNMLAVKRDFQSKGIGKKFVSNILRFLKKKSKYITCETDNDLALKFYVRNLKFKRVGNLIRLPRLMHVLIKKI